MKYQNGEIAHLGDVIELWAGVEGSVVCSIDTEEYSIDYPASAWSYLEKGILIKSDKVGLIHYINPESTFKLISRSLS